ncbi:hypothetical protein OH77DRAFT_1241846 [Trametes cingulata]|nr:hypothetical protein OH77DRAFT_1241846 [Trametes cingulata]
MSRAPHANTGCKCCTQPLAIPGLRWHRAVLHSRPTLLQSLGNWISMPLKRREPCQRVHVPSPTPGEPGPTGHRLPGWASYGLGFLSARSKAALWTDTTHPVMDCDRNAPDQSHSVDQFKSAGAHRSKTIPPRRYGHFLPLHLRKGIDSRSGWLQEWVSPARYTLLKVVKTTPGACRGRCGSVRRHTGYLG